MAADATLTPDTLRTLDQDATPGPWVASDRHSDVANGRHWRIESDADGYPNDGWVIASEALGPDGEANARLIAYVGTHLPEIISHLEAGWQPIEQAPTNQAVLIHIPSHDYYGNGGVYAAMLVDMGTGRRWMTFGWAIGRDLGIHEQPTHFRALPASPVMGEGA